MVGLRVLLAFLLFAAPACADLVGGTLTGGTAGESSGDWPTRGANESRLEGWNWTDSLKCDGDNGNDVHVDCVGEDGVIEWGHWDSLLPLVNDSRCVDGGGHCFSANMNSNESSFHMWPFWEWPAATGVPPAQTYYMSYSMKMIGEGTCPTPDTTWHIVTNGGTNKTMRASDSSTVPMLGQMTFCDGCGGADDDYGFSWKDGGENWSLNHSFSEDMSDVDCEWIRIEFYGNATTGTGEAWITEADGTERFHESGSGGDTTTLTKWNMIGNFSGGNPAVDNIMLFDNFCVSDTINARSPGGFCYNYIPQ